MGLLFFMKIVNSDLIGNCKVERKKIKIEIEKNSLKCISSLHLLQNQGWIKFSIHFLKCETIKDCEIRNIDLNSDFVIIKLPLKIGE